MIAIENYTEKDNQFYPTPEYLIRKMANKIDFKRVKSVLEPSAGKGDILQGVKSYCKIYSDVIIVDCVEIDPNLRAILKDKGYNVIGNDFLTFQTYSQYDLIIMNPPFKSGEKHLLKALEMCKIGGQICCILNAETLRNPCNVYRQDLVRKLEEYNASIEYISGGFSAAERKTDVDTAIVYVDIPVQQYSFDVFDKLIASEDYNEVHSEFSNTQLALNDMIDIVLKQYNNECRLGLELLNQFDRLESIMPKDELEKPLLSLGVNTSETSSVIFNTSKQNLYLRELRYKYWNILFQINELSRLFTDDVRAKLRHDMHRFRQYDFTLSNIKALQMKLSENLTVNIEKAILKQFEKLTYKHSMGCSKNIHYFNGWKTNDAYMINKKVIIPCYDLFNRFGYWNDYKIYDKLDELEKIFTYLDGGKTEGETMAEMRSHLYGYKKPSYAGEPLEFKYFRVEPKKKGTLHVWFKDLDLLKKFNIFGANKKGWLPDGYGRKAYKDMTKEEKAVIDDFQGEKDYNKVIENSTYYLKLQTGNNLLQIETTEEFV